MAHDLELLQVDGDIYGTAQTLCRYIAEATDNKFQIQAHAAGELAPASKRSTRSAAARSSARIPRFLLFQQGLRRSASAADFRSGSTPPAAGVVDCSAAAARSSTSALKRLNAHGIPAGITGAQMGAWFKKEINTLEDLKGLRFRIGGMGGPVLARVGAVPQHIAACRHLCGPGERDNRCRRIHLSPRRREARPAKVAKFNYFPCWWESGGMMHMVVNLEKWNALPKAYQAIVARACDAANAPGCSRSTTRSTRRRSSASSPAAPCSSRSRSRSWRPATRRPTSTRPSLSAKDAHFKRAFNSINAFRKEQLPWWEIAEHAYDSFMHSTRGRG